MMFSLKQEHPSSNGVDKEHTDEAISYFISIVDDNIDKIGQLEL